MRVLIVVGVVADVARVNGVSPTDPFVAEVLSPPNFIDELGAHLALQLLHYLLASLHSSVAVQPRHGLALVIKIALPLHEGFMSHTLFGTLCLVLCITTPLHANSTSVPTKNLNCLRDGIDWPLKPNTWCYGRPF